MQVRLEVHSLDGSEVKLKGKKLLERVTDESPPPLTVIDVGVGLGIQSYIFASFGYDVIGISLEDPLPIVKEQKKYIHVKENLFNADLPQADIVWASHIIEHMPNVGLFLERVRSMTKPDGWVCIVAPSDQMNLMVDGHLTFWTPAHLIYNMVVAGFDCRKAKYYTLGRDISLMVRRKDRPHIDLNYDYGDLSVLSLYFPAPIIHRETSPWLRDNFS